MRPEYVNQYKKLSPLERNNQLVQLFQQLPIPLHEQFEDRDAWISMPGKGAALEEMERRRNSENRSILVDRTDSLLILSQATRPFQAYILRELAAKYVRGIDQVIIPKLFSGLLFENSNTTPGIFSNPSAMEIERGVYRAETFAHLEMRRRFQEIYQERGFQYTDEPTFIPLDKLNAIFNVNQNKRFDKNRVGEYAREMEEAESAARSQRTLIQSWPNAFFEKYREEI